VQTTEKGKMFLDSVPLSLQVIGTATLAMNVLSTLSKPRKSAQFAQKTIHQQTDHLYMLALPTIRELKNANSYLISI
jgi:hypothetical protein